MKFIEVLISDDTDVYSEISRLNNRIPASTKNSPEFDVIYPQVTACIEDFSERAKKLAKTGTTIHILKEFTFPNIRVMIVLEYPRKRRLFAKLSSLIRRE